MKALLKLKIALQDLPHKCERTLLVPDDINMRQLHFIIQESFGWFNAHLFEFKDAKWKSNISVGMPDHVDMEWIGPPKQDAHKVKLKQTFLKENNVKAFWYWYDFGDDWWHKISFLKVSQSDLRNYKGIPMCIKAEGKCPPEDIGGPWGYADFLDAIKDKEHPEHYEYKEWCGLEEDVYDENVVEKEKINTLLKKFHSSKEWKARTYVLY
tara:strand:+ start:189 stop:818 length:630 start_codon:yes stop_codon:yes gene_type:complete